MDVKFVIACGGGGVVEGGKGVTMDGGVVVVAALFPWRSKLGFGDVSGLGGGTGPLCFVVGRREGGNGGGCLSETPPGGRT